jgi:AmmeMemoRadiSam system protein A
MLSPDQNAVPGTLLLRIARRSVEHGLEHGEPLPINLDELPGELAEQAATFTTLRKKGELRGCCGTLEAMRPLAADVAHSAHRAAFHDPRFGPVGRAELEGIRLDVSVLSPLEAMHIESEADLLDQLKPGVDGLVIIDGTRRATFLPKVWDMMPEPRRFLAQLKGKCGLPQDYWSERLEFLRYRTTTYAESV